MFHNHILGPKAISYLYQTLFPFKVVDAVFKKAHSTKQNDCLNYSNLHCQRFLHVKAFSFFNRLFLVFLVENDRGFDWSTLCMSGFCVGIYFALYKMRLQLCFFVCFGS